MFHGNLAQIGKKSNSVIKLIQKFKFGIEINSQLLFMFPGLLISNNPRYPFYSDLLFQMCQLFYTCVKNMHVQLVKIIHY